MSEDTDRLAVQLGANDIVCQCIAEAVAELDKSAGESIARSLRERINIARSTAEAAGADLEEMPMPGAFLEVLEDFHNRIT